MDFILNGGHFLRMQGEDQKEEKIKDNLEDMPSSKNWMKGEGRRFK